jgi:hypothetical protein
MAGARHDHRGGGSSGDIRPPRISADGTAMGTWEGNYETK